MPLAGSVDLESRKQEKSIHGDAAFFSVMSHEWIWSVLSVIFSHRAARRNLPPTVLQIWSWIGENVIGARRL